MQIIPELLKELLNETGRRGRSGLRRWVRSWRWLRRCRCRSGDAGQIWTATAVRSAFGAATIAATAKFSYAFEATLDDGGRRIRKTARHVYFRVAIHRSIWWVNTRFL